MMSVCQCRVSRFLALLTGTVSVAVWLMSLRDGEPSEHAVRTLWSLLQPTFSTENAHSPVGPSDLSLKEALEARVLALRAQCERKENDGDALSRKQSKLETALRGDRGQLSWCAHRLTMDAETATSLERLANDNINAEIQLKRDNYYSMPEERDESGDGMAWHIVEHPLLVLMRACLELRSGQTRWKVPTGQRSGPLVTLAEVLELAVTDDPLSAAADSCAVCQLRYDFVLHAGQLGAEVAFLTAEMGWRNTWTAGEAAEAGRQRLVRELARELPLVPRHLLRRVKQRFRRDLCLYGFRMDLDALLKAAQGP